MFEPEVVRESDVLPVVADDPRIIDYIPKSDLTSYQRFAEKAFARWESLVNRKETLLAMSVALNVILVLILVIKMVTP